MIASPSGSAPRASGEPTPLRHHLLIGAGAVGGTIGALLAGAGHRVTLLARPAVVAAVRDRGGLLHIVAGQSRVVPLEAVTDLDEVHGRPSVVHFTMKAGDLAPALEAARHVIPPGTLAVTWQNGIRAEPLAATHFHNLLGGVVRATSTMLVPGEVRIRSSGILIVGRWPNADPARTDPELAQLVLELRSAGFDAVASPNIRADKGLKLLVNLFSGVSPLLRSDDGVTPGGARLERNVVIEGARILKEAGIPFHPAGGRGDPVSVMLDHMAARPGRARTDDGVHNSTWQNLATPGRRLENDFMNGEIVALAASLGRSAPWNQRLLDILVKAQERGAGPESMSDRELGVQLVDLEDPPSWHPSEDGTPD